MSYCHMLSGNLANIGLTLGLGHPYGVEPGRVPARMLSHVTSMAASNPGCLDFVASDDNIFDDDFEDGDTDNWSSTVPPP
jgi:hypothetical protein